MKKIIAIILTAFVILSMSITSAFAYTAVVKPEQPKDPAYDVGVSVTLTDITLKDQLVEFYSVSRDGEKDKDSIIEGRIATFKIEITNKTDDFIIISDVLDSLDIQATNKNKNVLALYPSEIDKTEWKKTINASDPTKELTYSIKIITDDIVRFDVSLGGHTEEITLKGEKVDFMLVKDIKETESSVKEESSVEVTTETTTVVETTAATDETTTEAPVVNDETSTEVPETTTESAEKNELTTGDNVITTEKADDKVPSPTAPTYDTDDDYDYVEPEIPDTGISAAPFGAAGALVVSSITALIAKKRKLK